MRQEGHLQVFDLLLKAKSPIFIGCGKSYTKKEYLFDPRSNMVSFLDEQMFFAYLAQHRLADAYEDYMLRNTSRTLRDFLLSVCNVTQTDIDSWTRCRIDAGDALDEHHTLKEIQRFIRNGSNQVYVPGSSIKGALRTVLLKSMLLQTPPDKPNPELPFERRRTFFEENYFHTLSVKKGKDGNTGKKVVQTGNPLNSILRGLQISDSQPISEGDLCLTRKNDALPNGHYNQVNICRECIKPGTEIRCTVTLDQSILREKITIETIRQAIADASEHYQKTVTGRYPHASNLMNQNTILLGGGVGFQSKTVIDPYYGKDAVEITARVLDRAFRKHNHWKDPSIGISPRMLKETNFNGAACPYGVCEVSIR